MFGRAGTRLNCYRSRRIRPKAKWPPAVSKGCAFEKDLDALKRNLNTILIREFVGNSFPGFLGQSPLVYLI